MRVEFPSTDSHYFAVSGSTLQEVAALIEREAEAGKADGSHVWTFGPTSTAVSATHDRGSDSRVTLPDWSSATRLARPSSANGTDCVQRSPLTRTVTSISYRLFSPVLDPRMVGEAKDEGLALYRRALDALNSASRAYDSQTHRGRNGGTISTLGLPVTGRGLAEGPSRGALLPCAHVHARRHPRRRLRWPRARDPVVRGGPRRGAGHAHRQERLVHVRLLEARRDVRPDADVRGVAPLSRHRQAQRRVPARDDDLDRSRERVGSSPTPARTTPTSSSWRSAPTTTPRRHRAGRGRLRVLLDRGRRASPRACSTSSAGATSS